MKTMTYKFFDRTTYAALFVAAVMATTSVMGGVAVAFERPAGVAPAAHAIQEIVVIG